MDDAPTHPPADARALVTGSSGFIGRRLVSRLVAAGCEVACMVRRTSATGRLPAGVRLVTADLRDAAAVRQAVADVRPTVVFHAAGVVRAVHVATFEQVNVQGTAMVAAACAGCTEPPVLVAISSLAAAGPSTADRPRTEADEPAPVSDYGRSKLAGERAAAQHARDVPVTVVRPPVVFGPEDEGVFQMLRPVARWGVHVAPGGGRFGLSMVHVDDLVDGLLRAWTRGERVTSEAGPGSGVYFMAAPEQPTYAEVGRMMGRAAAVERVRVVSTPKLALRTAGALGDMMARLRRQPVWVNSDKVSESLAGSWTCCSRKAGEQLGWHPAASLQQRLNETAAWCREAGWL